MNLIFQSFHIRDNGDAIHVSNHSSSLFRSCIGFCMPHFLSQNSNNTVFNVSTNKNKKPNGNKWIWCWFRKNDVLHHIPVMYRAFDGSCVLKSLKWIKSDSFASKSVFFSKKNLMANDGISNISLQNMHVLFRCSFFSPSFSRQY